MPTLADELMGLVAAPLSRGTLHVCPDADEPEDSRNLSEKILEWCRFVPGDIDMERLVNEFPVTPGQATTYLQRFHRRGFLRRSRKTKSAGQRPMQVWKFTHETCR